MKASLLVTLLWLVTSAFAGVPAVLRTPTAVAAQLGAANEQLLVMVPTVRSPEIAEALRHAAVERDVKIYLIVSAEYVEEGGSFVAALSVLENVFTRLAIVDRAFAIGDRGVGAFLIEGDVLGQNAPTLGAQETYAVRDSTTLARRGRLFEDVWLAAPAYRSLIERLPFSAP